MQLLFIALPPPQSSTLFPYTTLFRSYHARQERHRHELSGLEEPAGLESRKLDRKSTRLNSSHRTISYAVFCLKKKRKTEREENHGHADQIRTQSVFQDVDRRTGLLRA